MGRTESSSSTKRYVIVVGCSGAIGQRLVRGLLQRGYAVVAPLHRTPLPDDLAGKKHVHQEFGFDIRSLEKVDQLFRKYAGDVCCVWNLAAPLSVQSERDPSYAEDITVKGMERILACMTKYGVKKICFSDSIGSFGESSPRENCPGKWLVENPKQDPGSTYGRQKRSCRELLNSFSRRVDGGDTRWAIIPGVLHDNKEWGAGTTEYALAAIKSAVQGIPFKCPVPVEKDLPMIYSDDLVKGLMALMEAPRGDLKEPENGYSICGFSFSAKRLFQELKNKYYPNFRWTLQLDEQGAALFADAWPCSLSKIEAQRDLLFESRIHFAETIKRIVDAHARMFQ